MLHLVKQSEACIARRVDATRERVPVPVRFRLHRLSLRGEHYGFIAIAAIDAFNLHQLLFIISIWLLITGVAAEFFGRGIE